jgi:hypothetical protein
MSDLYLDTKITEDDINRVAENICDLPETRIEELEKLFWEDLFATRIWNLAQLDRSGQWAFFDEDEVCDDIDTIVVANVLASAGLRRRCCCASTGFCGATRSINSGTSSMLGLCLSKNPEPLHSTDITYLRANPADSPKSAIQPPFHPIYFPL